MGAEHIPALMSALSVALSARTGGLTAHAVDEMRVKAEELLGRNHPAHPIIMTFCTMYEMQRRDPEAVSALGVDLERGINHVVWQPSPALTERRDIDG